MSDYEGTTRIVYDEGATFVPVCEKCGRYVKAPKTVLVNGLGEVKEPDINCSKCGKSKMIFEGYY